MLPNRLGLGLRPPLPSYGQGPSMQALAQQQQQMQYMQAPPAQKPTLFVGSISGGITDAFLTQLLESCGKVNSFKRLITPANKPQGFGFAEYNDPDSALRAMELLNGVELPALEDGCANKKLLIKADEKTKHYLDAYQSQKMSTDRNTLPTSTKFSRTAANNGLIDKEKYIIPPHLHDLQESDLPETQRGLVMTEIAQFRERAAKREREKLRDVQASIPTLLPASNGPKVREWGFVRGEDTGSPEVRSTPAPKSDEELENERKEARRKDEENSFKDVFLPRERRYEPRERQRIQAIERGISREQAEKEAQERDKIEMKQRLDVWDDDESDELFYIDRVRWRHIRARRLEAEEIKRRESSSPRQMDEMQSLAEEQRKAGMLLDDGAPVRLNVSIAAPTAGGKDGAEKSKTNAVFVEEEEEDALNKRKAPLVKLDFSVAESSEQIQERLLRIRDSVPHEADPLFKSKVRWDALSDTVIDRKFEPLVKRLMTKYLGEMEEEDLILFVLEHLKDHKAPHKLVEGLEPVRTLSVSRFLEEEATEYVVGLWRQIVFESMAYNEGILTEKMLVDD
ncbi:hypothetical protein FA13DRAFT_1760732 [Coprinellus micaceus]|uniref:RRM domain-containing protein n=1 Tax=Coprinellus micaceus TaxID=71717 RepID=A0A4Y7U1N7_COPMI|nr:hypothetical protein FA13DRAFT_1760732 [Coprinellus micaceus]